MYRYSSRLFRLAVVMVSALTLCFSCDEVDEGVCYTEQAFEVGNVKWSSDVSSSDREVLSRLISNMVKVESCRFHMGAQSQSSARANFIPSLTHRDTIWGRNGEAFWRDLKTKDTIRFNIADFNFIDTIRSKHDTVAYNVIYKAETLWVGPVIDVDMPDYYIGKFEITQAEWMAVMHRNPRGQYCIIEGHSGQPWYDEIGKGDNIAAYNIWFEDAVEFCQKLSAMTGLEFRLPTEAEWECAARGGKYNRGYRYPGSDSSQEVGWTYENACQQKLGQENYGVHAGGERLPNELGIYDMCGNVSEWVGNQYYRYGWTDTVNPQGIAPNFNSDDVLILHGGSWMQQRTSMFCPAYRERRIMSQYTTEAARQSAFVNCGFRIAVSAK
ncbi:MAG: SUMF1/EgtB/PvdO family nonheme iron enzyme [Bacteroidales bacterium]|nr:SUMF1/EgtB/PvdO family nonheme iron enzyme [Candidatus Liminaster caballi]